MLAEVGFDEVLDLQPCYSFIGVVENGEELQDILDVELHDVN